MGSYYEKITATGEVKCIDEEIPFEVPSSWCWCRLRDVCTKFSTGPFGTMVHKSDYADDGIPLVNPTNIKEQQIFADNICKVSRLKYKELSTYVLSENDVILARRGDLSKCAVVNNRQVGWLAGTGSFFLHMLDLSLDFFIMLYTSVYAQTYLIGDSVGTTMNNLNQGLLSKMLIPIPPLHEQSRIVAQYRLVIPFVERYTIVHSERTLLDIDLPLRIKKSILQEAIQGKLVPQKAEEGTAQELLEQIKEEKQKLVKEGKLKKSALNDSVIFKGDDNRYWEKKGKEIVCIDDEIPFEIPNSWNWCRLGNIGKTETGTTPSKSHPEYFGNYIPFIGPANISKSKIISETQGLSKEGVKYGRVVPKHTILQVCIGGSIGKCAIADKPITFNQQLNSITPYLCVAEFVHVVLQTEYFKLAIMDKATGTATPIINRSNWEKMLFPLPPLKEQQRIIKKVNEVTGIMSR